MTADVLDRLNDGDLLSDSEWVAGQRRTSQRTRSNLGISSSSVTVAIPFGTTEIIVGEPLPPWSCEAIKQVSHLGDLEANWDSFGGRPIDPHCAMAAIRLILSFLGPEIPPPAVIPTNRGGIQFEWHCRGVDFEIAIQSPSRYAVSFEDQESGEEIEQTLISDFQPLVDMFERISNKG
jgi:hypothetical protein